jgi:hypothetical protein
MTEMTAAEEWADKVMDAYCQASFSGAFRQAVERVVPLIQAEAHAAGVASVENAYRSIDESYRQWWNEYLIRNSNPTIADASCDAWCAAKKSDLAIAAAVRDAIVAMLQKIMDEASYPDGSYVAMGFSMAIDHVRTDADPAELLGGA